MRSRRTSAGLSAGLASLLRGGVTFASLAVVGCTLGLGQALAACELHARMGTITRVVQIQLDNVHLSRDEPLVPSDLEQMPRLRAFLASNGTIGSNRPTAPPSQRAPDVLAVLTGLLGDRMGVSIGDSYGSFRSDGSVDFSPAFGYWTASGGDGKPLMLADSGKMAAAPWVPFTRAGCDVGAFAVTGLTLQALDAEVANVLGSSEAEAAARDPASAEADLLGIAIHCARNSQICADGHARPDVLPDEPNGYIGFSGLLGNRHVQPAISPDGPVKGLDGRVIADHAGHAGFPGSNPTAAQSLGYAVAMLEAGVQVVYVAIGDAHKDGDPRGSGPGEPDYLIRLADYDAAFGSFVDRLAKRGITKSNTLFVVISTGNDRFTGGPPQTPTCDSSHAPCGYGPIGAIDVAIDRLVASQSRNVTSFDIQRSSTPAFYIQGNPRPTDPLTRTLEQDVGKLTALNPVTTKTDRLAAQLADRAQMQLMHMITASPKRTPSFLMFGDTNYVYRTTNSHDDCAASPACVAINPRAPWVAGDLQQADGGGWFGLVGPGVAKLGQTDIVSYPADLRPTLLALLGLDDAYVHDGVVLADALESQALPPEIARSRDVYAGLARAYWNLNAPFGPLGRAGLALATQAIRGSDLFYERYLGAIGAVQTRRDALALEMKTLLDGAAFAHVAIDPAYAGRLVTRVETLINEVEDLAGQSLGPADRPWKAARDAQ
ncbi:MULTISPECIES: hypothetical protein [unclassified Bradyrhizobium]|uniref:hypothetical protein n=1 Tax=unclassified Bradyrhizobium TaxID=2631580 RepID=UPI002915C508|nr:MULTISPECIES: hypothetical protein [unclassified Bradyrhizobium]